MTSSPTADSPTVSHRDEQAMLTPHNRRVSASTPNEGNAKGWESSHSSPGRGQVLAGGDGPDCRSLLPDHCEREPGAVAADRPCTRPGSGLFDVCIRCHARLFARPGHVGRYAWTDNIAGTDVYGSGCECPLSERGHEVAS